MAVDCQRCWDTYVSSSKKRATRLIELGRTEDGINESPDHTCPSRGPVRALQRPERLAVEGLAGRPQGHSVVPIMVPLRRHLKDAKLHVQAVKAQSWTNGTGRPVLLVPERFRFLKARVAVVVNSKIETVLYSAGLREAVPGYTPGYRMEVLRQEGGLEAVTGSTGRGRETISSGERKCGRR